MMGVVAHNETPLIIEEQIPNWSRMTSNEKAKMRSNINPYIKKAFEDTLGSINFNNAPAEKDQAQLSILTLDMGERLLLGIEDGIKEGLNAMHGMGKG